MMMSAVITASLAVLAWRVVPAHFWRAGGQVDAVFALDTSGSNAANLPAAKEGTCGIIGDLLPGDHLAVVWFDAEAGMLYRGTVGSRAVLNVVQQQVRSLRVSDRDGTVLPEALALVASAFEEFTGQRPASLKRRRFLVLFSDGQACPPSGTVFLPEAGVLPGLMTVVALGFEGLPQDRIVQSLQGAGATNDVHLVSMAEAKPALDALRKALRKAHPWRWPRVGGAVGLGLLLALLPLVYPTRRRRAGSEATVLAAWSLVSRDGANDGRPFRLPARPTLVGGDEVADLYLEGVAEALAQLTPGVGGVAVEVLAGEVILRDDTGSHTLAAGQTATITADAELTLEGHRLRLVGGARR
jgi:hypothetical protein